jgi:hypothetical protein
LEYRHLSLQAVGLLASVPLITAMIGDIVGGPKGPEMPQRIEPLI